MKCRSSKLKIINNLQRKHKLQQRKNNLCSNCVVSTKQENPNGTATNINWYTEGNSRWLKDIQAIKTYQ